jgi:hypothetical protein
MTGWGGQHRFWYLDLSAGPSFWSNWDLPLQVVSRDLDIDLYTPYGKKWFTEYLADYLWSASWNFAIPQFCYDPILTSKYRFVIHVLDNRTNEEKNAVPITSTVNRDRIESAFRDLAPYIETEAQIIFKDTSEYPELAKLIADHYQYLDSWTYWYVWDEPQDYGSVDMRPIYKYLQDNLAMFVPSINRDENEFTVPVFAFAFSGETYFTYGYKWFMDRRDPETGSLWGMACGDMVIIGLSQYDFRRGDEVTPKQPGKGYGLTQVIIHELGHMVGLMHPHSFDWLGDFSFSAMGYYTYDYTFGQFDKDALQRIHADKIMMETSPLIQDARIVLQSKIDSPETESIVDRAESLLMEANAEYSKMNYASAVKKAQEAKESLRTALAKAEELPEAETKFEVEAVPTLPTYIMVGVVIGLGVGCAATWLILRRKTRQA